MKKTIALLLVLCMMLAAVPVFAESAAETAPSGSGLEDLLSGLMSGSEGAEGKEGGLGDLLSGLMNGSEGAEGKEGGLSDLLSGLMGGSESGEGKEGGLGSMLSGLAEKLKTEATKAASALGSKLKEKLLKELSDPDSKLSGLLSKLTAGLAKSGKADVTSLLGSLLGGSDKSTEGTAEEGETLEETLERLNKEAEAETGDSVPGKKAAKSVEEFYGQWKESKFTLLGEEYDMSEYGEGAFIGENTYYVTLNGEKSPDYLYPETAELSIGNGILKVNSDGHWTNFVLTEDGSMVQPSGTIQIYFVRAE